jgi:hypothetical protein
MTDDNERKTDPNPQPPEEDPVADLKRGVGLLFRAAKNAAHSARVRVGAKPDQVNEKVEQAFKNGVDELHKAIDRLQNDRLEGALKTSLQEIGRAFGNVAQTLERELTRQDEKSEKSDDKKD